MADKPTLPCAGCHTPLPPEATGCQICMRSRTKQEIMRGYALLRENAARKRRKPFKILASALMLGAAAWVYANYGGRIAAVVVPAIRAASAWADDLRNPSNYARKPSAAVPAPAAAPVEPAEPGGPVEPEAALTSQLFPADPQTPPEALQPSAPAPARTPAPPRALEKNAWRVAGTVYDLATLEPVHGAAVTFLLNDQSPRKADTDENGRYELDLRKADGWTVSVDSRERRQGQVLDVDPPYRLRDADERRAALEAISDGDLGPASVEWKRSSSRVVLDLIVVPHRWTDSRRR